MQKITGATLWLGSIADELKYSVKAGMGLTIDEQQHRHLLECIETGADISIRLTPENTNKPKD